ncbi:MAG: carbohydrate porin, partial [Akkermansia sp.]|nr:carbohydrate porin [Akkermansia sp.]
ARCGVMDTDAAALSNVKAAATAGLVLQAPFRDSGWGSLANRDQLAVGFLWARAADSVSPLVHKNEYGVELSAVIQITPTFFVQPDVQYIFHPAGQTDRSGELVFQIQGVFKF